MDYSQNNKFKNIVAGQISLFGEAVLTRRPDEIMMIHNVFLDNSRPDSWRYNLDDKSLKLFDEYAAKYLETGDAEQKATA